jgi:hypothetical protein
MLNFSLPAIVAENISQEAFNAYDGELHRGYFFEWNKGAVWLYEMPSPQHASVGPFISRSRA